MIQHFLQSCWQNYPGPSATLHSSYEPCAVTPALLLHSCSAPASLLDPPCTLCSPGKIRQLTVWPGLPFSETTRSSRLPLPALPSLFSLHLSLFLSLSLSPSLPLPLSLSTTSFSFHLSRFLLLFPSIRLFHSSPQPVPWLFLLDTSTS